MKNHGDFLSHRFHLLFGKVGDVFAGDDHPAGIRFEKTHEQLQRDGFAHAASPQDADGFGRHDAEADTIKHGVVAETLGDFAELDVRLLRGIGHDLALELL